MNYFFFRVKHFPKDVRRFILKVWQRSKNGWSHQDTWNFDYYLAKVIGEGLIHMSRNTHTYPMNRDNIEQWKKELRLHGGIILSYNNIDDIYNTDEEIREVMAKEKESFRWLGDNFYNLWD